MKSVFENFGVNVKTIWRHCKKKFESVLRKFWLDNFRKRNCKKKNFEEDFREF